MNNKWNDWTSIVNAGNWLAGGFTWDFNDYSGQGARRVHGIVDMMRVPKLGYYMYRQNYTGIATDNPVSGTATRIVLTADVKMLDADGSDVSLISATERNAAGACINDVKNIQFSITGPATLFGATTKSTVEGRINAMIKSTTMAGAIVVVAQCPGLAPDSVLIASRSVIDSLDPSRTFVAIRQLPAPVLKNRAPITPLLRKTGHGMLIDFGHSPVVKAALVAITGRTIATRSISKASPCLPIPDVAKGVYILIATDDLGSKITRPFVIR